MHGEDARVEILKGHPQDEQAIAAFHPLAHRRGAGGPFIEAQTEWVALIQKGFGTEAGSKGPALTLQHLKQSSLQAKTVQFDARQHFRPFPAAQPGEQLFAPLTVQGRHCWRWGGSGRGGPGARAGAG